MTADIDNLIAEALKFDWGDEQFRYEMAHKLIVALESRQTTTRIIAAAAWVEGAQSRQCHCNAWSEGECTCGNFPGDTNPYRAPVTAPTETEKP